MIVNKITAGFVTQAFNTETNEFVSQEFISGDDVQYEDEFGEPVDDSEADENYLPFDMVQPEE
jgi:hypothetical protein